MQWIILKSVQGQVGQGFGQTDPSKSWSTQTSLWFCDSKMGTLAVMEVSIAPLQSCGDLLQTEGLVLPSAESHLRNICSLEDTTKQEQKVLFSPYLRQGIILLLFLLLFSPSICCNCMTSSLFPATGRSGQMGEKGAMHPLGAAC